MPKTKSIPLDEFNNPEGNVVKKPTPLPEVEILSAEEIESRKVTTLEKANITSSYIQTLKDTYKDIKVVDKDSREIAKNAKRIVQKTRTTGVAIFKYARSEINKQHSIIMEKEKTFVSDIKEVEDPIDVEIKNFDEAEEKRVMALEAEKRLPQRRMILDGLKIDWKDEEFCHLPDAEFMTKVNDHRQAELDSQKLALEQEETRSRIEKETLAKAGKDIRIKTMQAVGFLHTSLNQQFIYQNVITQDVLKVPEDQVFNTTQEAFDEAVVAWEKQVAEIKEKADKKRGDDAIKKIQEDAQAKIDEDKRKEDAQKKLDEDTEKKHIADLAKVEAGKGDKAKLLEFAAKLEATVNFLYPLVKSQEANDIVVYAKRCIAATKEKVIEKSNLL